MWYDVVWCDEMLCFYAAFCYTRTSSEVGGHSCLETYTLGIRIVYEGRHSTLIIFLQPNKNIALVNNMQTLKKYSDIFSELGTNPTPVELGLPRKCSVSCPILDFVLL